MGKYEIGPHGPMYPQFKGKPREAIAYLKRVKKGDALSVFYHPEIGEIDLPWGEFNEATFSGYGLAKIIGKHGSEFEKLNLTIADALILAFAAGEVEKQVRKGTNRYLLKCGTIKAVVGLIDDVKLKKRYVLTLFDITISERRKRLSRNR